MTVDLGDLTILIGANGTGKTTVLDALGLFGSESPRVTHGDFGRPSRPIKITLTVQMDASEAPRRFLRDGSIELQRSFGHDNVQGWKDLRAAVMHNRDFDHIRRATTASERKKEIKYLRKRYPGFPSHKAHGGWRGEFADYEHRLSLDPRHATRYEKRFVVVERSEIYLPAMLEVVQVPASRDIAADGEEGSESHLSRLMDLAIRSARQNDKKLEEIAMARDAAYGKYMGSVADTIRDINSRLISSSRRYMAGAEFTVYQEYPSQPPANPSASVHMKDGGLMVPIGRAGSGNQRVYLLSLLDTIAALLRESREGGQRRRGALPMRLIAIDEPELYQHPQRQRRMLASFMDMVDGDPSVLIVCSTHSPYFVRLKRVDSLRILQRGGERRIRSVPRGRLVDIMLPKRRNGGWAELSRWLDMTATRWITEGFFARLVVIVEGQGDRNVLLAAADALGEDLDGREITIVPATSFNNVEKFVRLFGEFGVRVYPVWDRDRRWDEGRDAAHKKDQDLADAAIGGTFGESLEGTVINCSFACLEDDMTSMLAEELHAHRGLLRDSARYAELEAEGARDGGVAARAGPGTRGAGARLVPKKATGRTKRFLSSRLNATELFRALREKDPERLESLTAAKIVRQLVRSGEEGQD